MEGIGGGDLVGDRFRAAVGHLGFGGLFQLAAKDVGDVGDLGLVGKRLEESLAQDVVDLVGGKVDRRDVALLAAQFGAGILEGAIDESDAGIIGSGEVGDDDADVLLLAGRGEQIREGARGDISDGAVAHFLGIEVVEVGRHLVEKDQDRLTAIEELQPVRLVRRLGAAGPERLELISLAELARRSHPRRNDRGCCGR